MLNKKSLSFAINEINKLYKKKKIFEREVQALQAKIHKAETYLRMEVTSNV